MAWSCEQCGRSVTSNSLMCDLCGSAAPGADAAKVALGGQRDLIMEAHLRALAIWQRVGAVLMAVAAVWLVGALALSSSRFGQFGGFIGGVGTVMAAIFLAMAIGSWVLGHFLSRYSNGARITAGVLTSISLAWQVVSTGFALFARPSYAYDEYGSRYGGYGHSSGAGMWTVLSFLLIVIWMSSVLWALFNRRSSKICTPEYRDIVAKTPELVPSTLKSPYFIIPAALTGFVLLLALVVILPRMM